MHFHGNFVYFRLQRRIIIKSSFFLSCHIQPIPFNFRTTQRSNFGVDAKNSVDSKAEEKKEFVPKLTDPVPFKFATDERIGCTSSTDNCAGFVSLKQKIESFCVRESHPTSENSTKVIDSFSFFSFPFLSFTILQMAHHLFF